METVLSNVTHLWDDLWERRDKRMDDYPLMENPLHTALICGVYFFLIIVVGPWYMKDRKPMNIKTFMVVYNAAMVILSTYMFIQVGNCWSQLLIIYTLQILLIRKIFGRFGNVLFL